MGFGLLYGLRPRTRHLLQSSALGRGRKLLRLLPKADATEGKEIERCVQELLAVQCLGHRHFALSLLHGFANVVGASANGIMRTAYM